MCWIIIAFISPIILVLFIWLLKKKFLNDEWKNYVDKINRISLRMSCGYITLFITLLGIYLAAFYTVFSDNDSLVIDPIEQLYIDEPSVDFSELQTANNDSIPPHIIFYIDKSMSMQSDIDFNSVTYRKYYDIVKSRCETGNLIENIKIKDIDHTNKIKRVRVIQLWLLYRISELKEYKGKVSIYGFGEHLNLKFSGLNISATDLRNISQCILNINFAEQNTNLCNVLEHLSRLISEKPGMPHEKQNYCIYILSDYIHDTPTTRKEDAQYEINKSFYNLMEQDAFVNFNLIKSSKDGNNTNINTLYLDESMFTHPKSTFRSIDLLREENFIKKYASYTRSTKYFPFYYQTHLSGNCVTKMTFKGLDKPTKYEIHINAPSDNELSYTFQVGDDNKQILSKIPKPVTLTSQSTLSFYTEGHVPAHFPMAKIIIDNVDTGNSYEIEVVFLKRLPGWLRWVIPCMLALLSYFVIIIFCNGKEIWKKETLHFPLAKS